MKLVETSFMAQHKVNIYIMCVVEKKVCSAVRFIVICNMSLRSNVSTMLFKFSVFVLILFVLSFPERYYIKISHYDCRLFIFMLFLLCMLKVIF